MQSDLVLQSVLISPERRSAIINGRLVALGDSFAGYQVAGIGESEVLLRSGGETRTLRLFPDVNMLSVEAMAEREKRKAGAARKDKPPRAQGAADGG
jgi:hypothetical protein